MNKASRILILSVCILLSCNNSGESSNGKTDTNASIVTPETPVLIVQCYENLKGMDTVVLQIKDSAGAITGKLDYHISGKDANTGSFTGTLYGDTLIADYSFRSEGVKSVRQIAFLKKDSFLIEGFGPVMEVHKMMVFKSRDSLSFNQVNRLTLVPCK